MLSLRISRNAAFSQILNLFWKFIFSSFFPQKKLALLKKAPQVRKSEEVQKIIRKKVIATVIITTDIIMDTIIRRVTRKIVNGIVNVIEMVIAIVKGVKAKVTSPIKKDQVCFFSHTLHWKCRSGKWNELSFLWFSNLLGSYL